MMEKLGKNDILHFFEDGNIYAWMCGTTSWTADVADGATDWKYAKLAGDTHE